MAGHKATRKKPEGSHGRPGLPFREQRGVRMKKLKRKAYEKHLEPMQLELVAMARWLAHTGKRVLVLLEGRDTSGKGGAIKAISEHVTSRRCRAVALRSEAHPSELQPLMTISN